MRYEETQFKIFDEEYETIETIKLNYPDSDDFQDWEIDIWYWNGTGWTEQRPNRENIVFWSIFDDIDFSWFFENLEKNININTRNKTFKFINVK